MEIDLARHAIRVAFRTARELKELLKLSKEQLGSEENRDFALGVAAAIDGITAAVTNKALSSHPGLKAEIESDLATFGRLR